MSGVATTGGPVVGVAGAGVRTWRGVPYARADRFGPAGPAPSWTAPRECGKWGPVAPQLGPDGDVLGEEDGCLVLDVHRPDGAADLPVLLFVHGGAFVGGGCPDYDAGPLAARCSAVVVVVQYRLGALGFLAEGGPTPALTDLVEAVRWTAGNAERFGGDPDRITLAGQSAGAMLACALAAAPDTRRHVRRVLAWSGAVATATPEQAARTADDLRRVLGATPASASVDELVRAGRALMAAAPPGDPAAHPWRPVVDGAVLPGPIGPAVAAGELRDLELWAATCRDEGAFFLADGSAAERDRLTEHSWRRPARELVAAHAAAGGRGWLSRFDHVPGLAPFTALGATHGADNACLWAQPPRFPPRPLLGRAGAPMGPADLAATEVLHGAVRSFVHGAGPGWPAGPDEVVLP